MDTFMTHLVTHEEYVLHPIILDASGPIDETFL